MNWDTISISSTTSHLRTPIRRHLGIALQMRKEESWITVQLPSNGRVVADKISTITGAMSDLFGA